MPTHVVAYIIDIIHSHVLVGASAVFVNSKHTTLHLAMRQATVSIHRPVHSKIMLTLPGKLIAAHPRE